MSKENINLPKTAFSMKANLPTREPDIINYWEKIGLFKELTQDITSLLSSGAGP